MSPELENLIRLYAEMHEAPADRRDVHFERLRLECERVAPANKCSWRDIMAFVKKRYFATLNEEDRKHGRR